MSEIKKVLTFSIEDSEQVIGIVKSLTELNVDLNVDSTPSSIEIEVQGPEWKVRGATEKIQKIVKEEKSFE